MATTKDLFKFVWEDTLNQALEDCISDKKSVASCICNKITNEKWLSKKTIFGRIVSMSDKEVDIFVKKHIRKEN